MNINPDDNVLTAHVLSEEDMRANGFIDHVKGQWYFYKNLGSSISFDLFIEKETNAEGEHDFSIKVLDNSYLQHYDYQRILATNPHFEFASYIKSQVEDVIQDLERLGILKGFVKGMHI